MNKSKGIFWLASYPKSGNTWFRVFLANLLNMTEKPVDINCLHTGMIASAREWMENALGFESAHLSHDELDALRPYVYEWYSREIEEVGYHKIHDAYTYLENQRPMIPAEGCLGTLYFIRNPLDISISFANHLNCCIDEAIESMGNPKFAFCKGKSRQHIQLRQWLLSWSMHVKSWVEAKDINVLVLRYEDMKLNSQETFSRAVQFLQLDKTPEAIEQALENAKIEKLQQWEEELGFSEKPIKTKRFFRKGIVGDWQTTLTQSQVQRIVHDHADMMRAFGYLDEEGNPVVFGREAVSEFKN
jgi:aryl sulfotransferase